MAGYVGGIAGLPTRFRRHITRNSQARRGNRRTEWEPGEQERLIAEALEAKKLTKLSPGQSEDQLSYQYVDKEGRET